MKYIRMKGDILLQDINNDKYCAWLQTEPTLHDIISEADTIEELCDEFVAYKKVDNEDTRFRNYILDNYEDFVREKDYILEHYNVYGALWTNKGLIYVAKMNDKGELELL